LEFELDEDDSIFISLMLLACKDELEGAALTAILENINS